MIMPKMEEKHNIKKKGPLKIAFKALAIFFLILGPSYVYASNAIEVFPAITASAAGEVYISPCVSANAGGFITYHGYYPDTSSVATNNTNFVVCSLTLPMGQPMEGGYLNGAGTTGDGPYWVKYTYVGSSGSPDYSGDYYYWAANRAASIWGASSTSTTVTRIITTTPADQETVASSTTFTLGMTGYITPDDFGNGVGVNVHIRFRSMDVQPTGAFGGINQDLYWSLSSFGSIIQSTTTDLSAYVGNFTMYTAIEHPAFTVFGYGFFTRTLAQTLTQFVVGTSTQFGALQAQLQRKYIGLGGNYGLSTTTPNSVCTPLTGDFDLAACVMILVIPDQQSLTDEWTSFQNGFLSKFPWGYVTRFGVIMTGNATDTLPTFTVTLPESSTTNTTLSFDPADIITGGGLILDGIQDPIYHKTTREIAEPIIDLLLAIAITLQIIFDLLGTFHNSESRKMK